MKDEPDFAPIAGICERDVDLLLYEEFVASPRFLEWFVRCVDPAALVPLFLMAVHRSRTDSTGESDLEAAYVDSNGTVARILIENKVGAGFQPRQAERYRERAAAYLARGEAERVTTVLVAPDSYLGSPGTAHGFEHTVTYEKLRGWFAAESSLGRRRTYKIRLLEWATDRSVLGYQPRADAAISDLWHAYWELARDAAPELEMEEPGPKPGGATWIGFRPPELPPGTWIVHKLERGFVDLQLPGRGPHLSRVRQQFEPLLEDDMQIARASKSAALRIHVPKLDVNASLSSQTEAASAGLRAAGRLLAVYKRAHRTTPELGC